MSQNYSNSTKRFKAKKNHLAQLLEKKRRNAFWEKKNPLKKK